MANVSSSNGLEKRPKLRFPGFDEPWHGKPFGDLIHEYSDRTQTENEDTLLSAAIEGMFLNTELFGHQRGASNRGYKKIKYGTMVLSTQNLHLGNANVNLRFKHGMVSPAYKTYDITGCSIELLAHWIKSDAAKHFLYNATTVGASMCRRNVEWETLYEQPLFLPSPDEQDKIASILSILAQRIDVQQKYVAALKKYKRGLLHEILCEKIKVTKSAWDIHKIGDYLSPKNIKQLPTPDAPLMAFTATGGVCDKGERYDRGFLVKDASTKLYKRTDLNDFIYSSNNLDVGSIGLNLYGSAVISDVYEIFSISGADPWFISEAIQQKPVLHQILKYRQGCLYGQYRIYADDFLGVPIRVPSLETQKQIGTIFSRLEYKIKSEQALLGNLESTKTFFLQQLFI